MYRSQPCSLCTTFCPFRNVLWCKRQRNRAPPKCCAAVAHHGVTQGDVAIWCCTSCCICRGALKQCRITLWEMLCQRKTSSLEAELFGFLALYIVYVCMLFCKDLPYNTLYFGGLESSSPQIHRFHRVFVDINCCPIF